jgi:hypothetical protein
VWKGGGSSPLGEAGKNRAEGRGNVRAMREEVRTSAKSTEVTGSSASNLTKLFRCSRRLEGSASRDLWQAMWPASSFFIFLLD